MTELARKRNTVAVSAKRYCSYLIRTLLFTIMYLCSISNRKRK